MTELSESFISWVLEQGLPGKVTELRGEGPVACALEIETGQAKGAINVYDLGADAANIVEFRIVRKGHEDDPAFHLHFEMLDLARAQELFGEMRDVLERLEHPQPTKVLLCCSGGLTTTMFADELTRTAERFHQDYVFEAKGLERAIEEASRTDEGYACVMLAPQVGYLRDRAVRAFPGIPVFEVPAKTFGTYDALGAFRLVMDALEQEIDEPDPAGERIALEPLLDLARASKVLVILLRHLSTGARLEWRLYEHDAVVKSGRVVKGALRYHDARDLIATLACGELDVASLDAIGIAVPGIVQDGTAMLPWRKLAPYDLAGKIEARFGVPTFVENDANAACVGCYVSQGDYENVTLLVQHAGHVVGGAGTIVGGRLVKGYKGYAGEIKAIQQLYSLPEDVESRAWSPEAMTQVAMAHIVAVSSLVAPEACFVAMDMVPDMEALKVEVEKHMPAAFAPTLIHVANERERTFLGMFALALSGLQAR